MTVYQDDGEYQKDTSWVVSWYWDPCAKLKVSASELRHGNNWKRLHSNVCTSPSDSASNVGEMDAVEADR